MLSYQHIYHAGNHADVLKHLSLMAILHFLAKKSKPATLIDTHAGAGQYSLNAADLKQNLEYEEGVARLLNHHNSVSDPLLATYLQQVITSNQQGFYGGSVDIMHNWLREQDQLHAIELHPRAFTELSTTLHKDNAHAYQKDCFSQLNALVPPIHKRGLVLIDPPYEDKSEYSQVIQAVSKANEKWATACYAIWYPLLSERAGEKAMLSDKMRDEMVHLPVKNAWSIEFRVHPNQEDVGMYGSGMLILNCPYQVDTAITDAMLEVAKLFNTSPEQNPIQTCWHKAPM